MGTLWGQGMGSPSGSESGLEQSLRTTSYCGPGGSALGLVLLTRPYFSPPSLPWMASPPWVQLPWDMSTRPSSSLVSSLGWQRPHAVVNADPQAALRSSSTTWETNSRHLTPCRQYLRALLL